VSPRYHFFPSAEPETHGSERSDFFMGSQGTVTPPEHKAKRWEKRKTLFPSVHLLPSQLLQDGWRDKATAGAGVRVAPLMAVRRPDISELGSPGRAGSCCSRSGASTSPIPCLFPALVCLCLLTRRICIRACQWMSAGFTLTSSS